MKIIAGLTLFVFFHSLPSFGEDAGAEVGHKPTLREEKDIRASFVKLKPMLRMVREDSKFTLYQGLPRQNGNPEQLDNELNAKTSITRFGFAFYKTPRTVEAEDAKQLTALVQGPSSFIKFRGYKLCGGFHPDFALVWGTGEEAVEIHVCFGCHEVMAFQKGVEVYCDIPAGSYEALKTLLQKYHKQPNPKRG